MSDPFIDGILSRSDRRAAAQDVGALMGDREIQESVPGQRIEIKAPQNISLRRIVEEPGYVNALVDRWEKEKQSPSPAPDDAVELHAEGEVGVVQGFTIEEGALLQVPIYEPHQFGKNWMAAIHRDPAAPNGLGRVFIERGHGQYYYVLNPNVRPGQVIEFGADYEKATGSRRHNRWIGVVLARTEQQLVMVGPFSAPTAFKLPKDALVDLLGRWDPTVKPSAGQRMALAVLELSEEQLADFFGVLIEHRELQKEEVMKAMRLKV